MTIQSVVQEVCSFVGVRPINGSLFVSPYQDRTPWEFVQLANEMAQRIAYDTRDWTILRTRQKLLTTGIIPPPEEPQEEVFQIPSDYQRLLVTSEIWRSDNTNAPMFFISDPDDWLRRELQNCINSMGEWCIFGNEIHIRPVLSPGIFLHFYYLRNTPVRLFSGGFGSKFVNDADTFVLPERLLKLAMIWQWKANKGATYAEDLANYEDALTRIAGNDKPSPVIIGSRPVSPWDTERASNYAN